MILFFILVFLFLATITSKIQIEIKGVKINSKKEKYINENYNINFILKIFFIFPILKLTVNSKKIKILLSSKKIKEKLEKRKVNLVNIKYEGETIRFFKKLNLRIKELDLKVYIGTEDAALTAIIVPIITMIVSLYLKNKIKKYNDKKEKFLIMPIYNQNLINIEISGIFQIEMIHIINTICILYKERKGDKKNERTPNRRSHDYSYE